MPGTLPTQEYAQPQEALERDIDEQQAHQEATEHTQTVIAAEQKVYTFDHGEGRTFSGTVAEAMAKCRGLGGMSVENAMATLEESDLAARVAARGKQKREASEQISKKLEAKPENPKQQSKVDISIQLEQAVAVVQPTTPVQMPLQETRIQPLVTHHVEVSTETITDEAHIDTPEPLELIHAQSVEATAKVAITDIAEVRNQEVTPVPESPVVAKTVARPEPQHESADPHAPAVEIVENNVLDNTQDVRSAETTLVERQLPEVVDAPLAVNYDVYTQPDENMSDVISELEFELTDDGELIVRPTLMLPELVQDTFAEEDLNEQESELIPTQEVSDVELATPIAVVESAIVRVVEVLDSPDIAESAPVHDIVQRIVVLAHEQTVVDEIDGAELPKNEQLAELFIELLEEVGLEPSEDLIQSLIMLTKTHHFEALLKVEVGVHEHIDESDVRQIGTREFLQKLQKALYALAASVSHYSKLGKSMLRLYSLQPA